MVRGVDLRGRLVDANGNPVKPTRLTAHAVSGPTSVPSWARHIQDDGSFVLRGLPRGKVRLFAYVGKENIELGVFDAPGKDIEITLP